mgnify:CR=1 FL=1
MKTTIKFFAALFILLISNNIQAQSSNNECVQTDVQIVYHGDGDMACYDVYVYTSQIVSSIGIDGANDSCTDVDTCVRTLCFSRTNETYEVYIEAQIETDNANCRASRVGAVVTIAP